MNISIRNMLAILGYLVGAALFSTLLWRARGMTGATSGADAEADKRLTRELKWLMAGGFAALLFAFLLSNLRAV